MLNNNGEGGFLIEIALPNGCSCICGTYLLCELTEAKSHTYPPKEVSFN